MVEGITFTGTGKNINTVGIRPAGDGKKGKFGGRVTTTTTPTTMPDLYQSNPAYNLPGGGDYHCGPTAVANIMIWLDRNGFPDLIDGDCDTTEKEGKLISHLGELMETNPDDDGGTGTPDLINGIKTYMRNAGYNAAINYIGFHNKAVGSGPARTIGMPLIKSCLEGRSNLILHYGTYTYDTEKETYVRAHGHFVTAISAKEKSDGTLDVIVHNPGDGEKPQQEVINLKYVTNNDLKFYRKPLNANGESEEEYFSPKGHLIMTEEGDDGKTKYLIDGVIQIGSISSR